MDSITVSDMNAFYVGDIGAGGPHRITACADGAGELSGLQVWYNDYDSVAGPLHGNMRSDTTCSTIQWSKDNAPFGSWVHKIDIARRYNNTATDKIVGIRITTRDYSDLASDDTVMQVGLFDVNGVTVVGETLTIETFDLKSKHESGQDFFGFDTTHAQVEKSDLLKYDSVPSACNSFVTNFNTLAYNNKADFSGNRMTWVDYSSDDKRTHTVTF